MPLPSKDKIVGFNFEKQVVLIETGKFIAGERVHELLPLTEEDKEVICDAWLDYRYRKP